MGKIVRRKSEESRISPRLSSYENGLRLIRLVAKDSNGTGDALGDKDFAAQ